MRSAAYGFEGDRIISVDRSELQKIADVLGQALRHHQSRDESNAALHLAEQARWSPLTSELDAAFARVNHLLAPLPPE